MATPKNFLPSREMSAVYFHASVTQSQDIVLFLVPSQIKNESSVSQNNLKPLGPYPHC